MPSFEALIKEKSDRLEQIPLKLQTVVEKQQNKVLNDILSKLYKLETKDGEYLISSKNIRLISEISDELKSVFLNKDYLESTKEFASEFEKQAVFNQKLIEKGFGETISPVASEIYIQTAKKNAIESLIGSPIDKEFIKPIQSILETAVVNGASINDTMDSIATFVKGSDGNDSKILKYAKQISNDSFAISDASYTSIISDYLDAEWFYYSGSEVDKTRCFCHERVGNYYHYKEIESWGNGENLGKCDLGGGEWAGEIPGTNAQTIYSYRGGYNCMHFFVPVSEFMIPDSDLERARNLGYID